MYQKLSDLRKYLIISVYVDFIRFCFLFFFLHWLMGNIVEVEYTTSNGRIDGGKSSDTH